MGNDMPELSNKTVTYRKDSIMKKLRLISMCLALILMLSGFSACANPPATSSPSAIPDPGDQIAEEEEIGKPDPVDLSVLSEEELGKIKPGLLDTLKNSDKDDSVSIMLNLVSQLQGYEAKRLANERIAARQAETKELNATLESLKQSYNDELTTSKERESISKEIEEINKLISENDISYNKTVWQIFDETNTPIIEEVISDYNLEIIHKTFIATVAMSIDCISANAQTVIELAKDERVESICVATVSYEDAVAEIESVKGARKQSGTSTAVHAESSSSQYSSTKVNEIYDIIDGEIAVNNNKKGDGITIALIDHYIPDPDTTSNVLYYDVLDGYHFEEEFVGDHATYITKILNKIVPNSEIISVKSYESVNSTLNAIDTVMSLEKDVDIISISIGTYTNYENGITDYGKYTQLSKTIDLQAINYNIPIVFSSGNSGSYVSEFGLAPNSICVGTVQHYGTTPEILSPFRSDYKSAYRQFDGNQALNEQSMINKPDFCAPGDIYSNSEDAYTSYSVPFVAGTIAQMMSRNTNYTNTIATRQCSLLIKATLMASCFYDAGTAIDVYGICSSNKEGAGVINAGACYDTAANSKYSYYSFTSLTTQNKSIYIHDTTKPLRIAIAWDVEPVSNTSFNNTEFNLYVYKDGVTQPIARSYARSYLDFNSMDDEQAGPVTNYEYVEIPASTLAAKGAGTYIAKIIPIGTQSSVMNTDVAIAWSQYTNTDA